MKRKTTEDFIKKCKDVHNGKYDYSNIVYTGRKNKIEIICREHGSFFIRAILHSQGVGCPGCRDMSSGEAAVQEVLQKMNIEYRTQYSFEECRHKKPLKFDFFVESRGLIEFDGKQHFESVKYFGGEEGFQNTILRDKIKNIFCITNNIPLLRIPYYDKLKVEELITEFLDVTLFGVYQIDKTLTNL